MKRTNGNDSGEKRRQLVAVQREGEATAVDPSFPGTHGDRDLLRRMLKLAGKMFAGATVAANAGLGRLNEARAQATQAPTQTSVGRVFLPSGGASTTRKRKILLIACAVAAVYALLVGGAAIPETGPPVPGTDPQQQEISPVIPPDPVAETGRLHREHQWVQQNPGGTAQGGMVVTPSGEMQTLP